VKNQDALRDRFADVQTEIRQLAGVEEVSAASNIPGRSFNQNGIFESTHPENDIDVSELVVDHDFLKVLNISLAEGRDFLRENPADAD
ncbi:hypothetical protein, partial [Enterococcus casseliflavus]|uniref:hypothetical protein n=1 Tax=Enterococcus casseliflavus TaxID=37734 RepID=UPI003D0B025B